MISLKALMLSNNTSTLDCIKCELQQQWDLFSSAKETLLHSSGNELWQWELITGSGNALSILFPTNCMAYFIAVSLKVSVVWSDELMLLAYLVRNVDSSIKLYMYLCFLQLMIRAQVGDLSSHSTKYSSPVLTHKVFANMRRVGKGFSGADTPLFEGMLVAQEVGKGTPEVNVEDVPAAGVAAEGAASDDVNAAVDEPSIPSPTPPPPPSQDILSTSQVQITPPQSPQAQLPSPQQQPQPSQDAEISMDLLQNLLDTCTTLTRRVKHLEQDKIAQDLEITKLKQRVKKLERRNKLKGRIIANMDANVDVTLKDIAKDVVVEKPADVEESADVFSMQDDEVEPAELQEVVEVVTTAKLMTKVVTAASTVITIAALQLTTAAAAPTLTTAPSAARKRKGVVIRDPQETATPSTIIYSKAKFKDKGKGILVEEPKPLKKQAQIKQDEAYARKLKAELNKNIDWDEVIDHVKRKRKEDNAAMRYQALKRKPHTEGQARKNIMVYLRNMAGYKMDYFKGMSYNDVCPVFEKYFNSNVDFLQKTKEQMDEEDNKALKRINENQEDKATKRQKLDEEVEELRRHIQIVPNDEDDVYTEATPLALKVPVVDYEIYNEHNKPYYKIKRANGSHQLYLSFLSMLRNFDRENLEALWRLVKERFASTKPKNFSDDFLLKTLGAMFEKPYIIILTTTQLILLVERKYPLTSFGVDAAEDFKEKVLRIKTANKRLSAAKTN
nr:hypothetical protein [Tanacetum cinerariifolium]